MDLGGQRNRGHTGTRVGWAGQKTSPGNNTRTQLPSFITSRTLILLFLPGVLSSSVIFFMFYSLNFYFLGSCNFIGSHVNL